jgi:hypothetical protein
LREKKVSRKGAKAQGIRSVVTIFVMSRKWLRLASSIGYGWCSLRRAAESLSAKSSVSVDGELRMTLKWKVGIM